MSVFSCFMAHVWYKLFLPRDWLKAMRFRLCNQSKMTSFPDRLRFSCDFQSVYLDNLMSYWVNDVGVNITGEHDWSLFFELHVSVIFIRIFNVYLCILSQMQITFSYYYNILVLRYNRWVPRLQEQKDAENVNVLGRRRINIACKN